jgi:hypothetical protein
VRRSPPPPVSPRPSAAPWPPRTPWRRSCRRRRRGRRGGAMLANVPPPLGEPEAPLPLHRPRPADERLHRQPPDPAELPRERLRRPVPPLQRPVAVGGDVRQRRHVGPRQRLGHERAGVAGEAPEAPILPGVDEAPGPRVVDDRRPRRREGDPPAAALRAPTHRPRPRGAAAGAERRRQPDQRVAAARAEEAPADVAGGAAGRQQEVEQHSLDRSRPPVTRASRDRADFVNSRARTRRARACPARGGACCRRAAAAPCRRCRARRP